MTITINRRFFAAVALLIVGTVAGLAFADYQKGTLATTATIGMPNLGVRVDTAADDAGANLSMGRMSLDSAGALRVTQEGGKKTYYGVSQFACDSTATDIAVFQGSATATIKLIGIRISTTATAAATGDVTVLRRTVADTAGTTANSSLGQASLADAAPSGQPIHYTVHPSALGAAGQKLWGERIVQQAAGTPQGTTIFIDFKSAYGGETVRLSGIADFIAINVPAALGGTGNAWDIVWIWQEEPTTA